MGGKVGSVSFDILLVDGYSLLAAKPKGFQWKAEAKMERSDGLGDAFEAMVPTGISRYTASQNGAFFDDTSFGFHQALLGHLDVSRVLCAGYHGNTIGKRFIGAAGAYTPSYDVLGSAPNLTKANASYEISGAVEHGILLQEWATRADDWDTAAESNSVDNAASSANGGAGYLQISGFAGPNTGTALIRHSDDNLNWSTLLTFTVVNGFPDAERVAVSGTVKRYLSFKWTGFGNLSASSSTSASLSPSVSASSSASPSLSPSSSRSPSASTSLSPSSSRSPSASTSLSPSSSLSPSVSASASSSPSISPSVSASASASPSSGGVQASSVTLMAGFARL